MKPSITVAGLGPGDPGLLTLAAADALRNARRLILRTGRHGAARWLEEQGIPFESFDGDYDRFEDFDSLHEAMARRLWTWAPIFPQNRQTKRRRRLCPRNCREQANTPQRAVCRLNGVKKRTANISRLSGMRSQQAQSSQPPGG